MSTPLGERIKDLRTSLGWSSGELAKKSGVSRAYLWQLERGGKERPGLQILEKLAAALGVGLPELTGAVTPLQTDEPVPPGLKKLLRAKREILGITDGDIEVLRAIHFRGNRPRDPEDWELLYLFLRKWAKSR